MTETAAASGSGDSPRLRLGVAFISVAILTVELTLVRVMEVILAPSTGYMVLTSAMFALGLGGIYLYLFPLGSRGRINLPWWLSLAFAAATPALLPLLNALPFSVDFDQSTVTVQAWAWGAMYVAIIIPFFIGGVILSHVFTVYSAGIHRLYLFDLVGAAVACLVFLPLLPAYGPGGLLFVASALALLAAAQFAPPVRPLRYLMITGTLAMALFPLTLDDYLEFRGHANKRGNDRMIAGGLRELVEWDPVSKLEVFNASPNAKLFSIDGGQQGSWMRGFDGDYEGFEQEIAQAPDSYYFGRNSMIHHLYRGRRPEVLVIGAAVGGESLAALTFGAAHVDAIDLVGAMIDAAKNRYADYSGGVYNHPRVRAFVGEGRSYLRSTPKKYDIIQMFSNHTSSAIASGTMAAGTAYLQTVEAYTEYFEHLKPDGALQINHHVYPRMLTTAAQAWHRQGRDQFWRHVAVLEACNPLSRPSVEQLWRRAAALEACKADTLPTVIIKMQPWDAEELRDLLEYANREHDPRAWKVVPHRQSERILRDNPHTATLTSDRDVIEGVEIMLDTNGQNGLPFDVTVSLADSNGTVLRAARLAGAELNDDTRTSINFEPLIATAEQEFTISIAAGDTARKEGLAVWLDRDGDPVVTPLPRAVLPTYLLVFDPLDPEKNLVPERFLKSPFPYADVDKIGWNLTPVTDDSPYFHMIRKRNAPIASGSQDVLDRNTAHLLNVCLQRWIPKDWFHLAVVAVVSLGFAFVFVVVPFFVTGWRDTRWEGMQYDIVYFCCLGLGFIMIEIAFIQLFKKLIGYPTHTFTTVVFSMLVSAGIGSGLSKRLLNWHRVGWISVFGALLAYGLICALTLEAIFHAALSLPLYARIAVTFALISPLGFVMGMPFPMGIEALSGRSRAAIPWAWALNGFFTVFGGYLAILLSIRYGFGVVLYISLAIYGIAMLSHRQLRSTGAVSRQHCPAPA